jgi:hypothetical protein
VRGLGLARGERAIPGQHGRAVTGAVLAGEAEPPEKV